MKAEIIHFRKFQARKNQDALEDLKRQLSAAENILAKRDISCVEDLNIGDLSAFMEISVPMECLEGFHWPDYPYLNKLYQVGMFPIKYRNNTSSQFFLQHSR